MNKFLPTIYLGRHHVSCPGQSRSRNASFYFCSNGEPFEEVSRSRNDSSWFNSDTLRNLSSSVFTFQIGPDSVEITVHSSTLAELSRSLNTLLKGVTIEVKNKHVDWPDVDLATFNRLCEFAYLRDHIHSSHRIIEVVSPPIKPPRSAKKKERL
jgi:hypothetical protein